MPNLRPRLDDQATGFSHQVIQGSASPLDAKARRKTRKITHDWQLQAYEYYNQIGEVYYGANFIGNCLARIRLIAAEQPKNLSEAPLETTNKTIVEAVRNFTNTRTGQTGLMRRFGHNMFLAGEVFLHGTEDDNGDQTWEIYSTLEFSDNGDGSYTLIRGDGMEPELLNDGELITRIWKEHPARAFNPDSAMRTCRKQCEKLLILDRQDMAVAKSRYAGSGILVIPAEIVPPAIADEEGNIEEDPAKHPFVQDIQDSMIEPVVGDEQPEDVVPFVVVGQAEYLKEMRHIQFDKPLNPLSEEQKMATIRRMATAMDLPNEVLLGMEDTNHWTAWQIKEETFQTHIRPFVEMICNSLTVAYLHPQLKELGVKDYTKYIFWYDDTNLVARPDKAIAAQKAYDSIAISDKAYRRDMGYTEEDAPNDEEFIRRAGVHIRNPFLIVDEEPADIATKTYNKLPNESNTGKGSAPQDKKRGDPNQPGPAKSPLPGTDAAAKESARKLSVQASGFGDSSAYLQGYLEASIDRALEKAGAKVRTSIPKTDQLSKTISELSNDDIYGCLGGLDKSNYNILDEEYLDFEPACKVLKEFGFDANYDFNAFKTAMRAEALRKANSDKRNFSLNMDILPK